VKIILLFCLTKNINIGSDLLQLLKNVTRVWFLGDAVYFPSKLAMCPARLLWFI